MKIEDGGIFIWDTERLLNVMGADVKRPYTLFEEKHTPEGTVIKTPICTLETHVLKKLKAKAIHSLRGEFEMLGRVDMANLIIFGK